MRTYLANYNSLFWKIFIYVWLSNLTIIVVAAILIIFNIESSRQQKLQESRMELTLKPLIAQYEKGIMFSSHSEETVLNQFFELTDLSKGINIYGQIPPDKKALEQAFEFKSANGLAYQIKYFPSPYKLELSASISSYFSPLRILLSILIMSIFSALLSKLIIKPIKQLSKHVKKLTTGEQLEGNINEDLINRKDEIGQLAVSIEQMSTRINQLISDKQNLLYDVSHELRAPIARMQVANALTAQMADSAGLPQKAYLQIDKDIDSLNQMIDEILSLARIEHAPESGATETFCLNAFLQQQIDNVSITYPDRTIKLHAERFELETDKKLLNQAINNLINNALKHTAGDININVLRQKNTVTIAVSDEGKGIPEKQLTTIFKPFARGDSSAKGFGLGLAIVAKAIDRINGDISAENIIKNEQTIGLLISVTLPVKIS